MKLIGELKDKVETAETLEEKKEIIAQAGMELTDEELNEVAGGAVIIQTYEGKTNKADDDEQRIPEWGWEIDI